MKAVIVPGASKTRSTTQYRSFRGVDFASDIQNVDGSRSPMAPNLISDASGYPEKRPGWRTLHTYAGGIRGIHRCRIGDQEHILVHAGNRIYRHSAEPAELFETASAERSVSVVCSGKLWILTGAEYLCFDGSEIKRVRDAAYVPTTVIGAAPAGGGRVFEPVNLLSQNRKNAFLSDGAAKEYKLDSDGISGVESVFVDGEELDPAAYTADTEEGKVIFAAAPPAPAVTGRDNVVITFSKPVSGYADSIEKCRIFGVFGLGGADSDRIFFSGNPEKPNVDWHCDISAPDYNVDPSYVPDTSFAFVGSDENAIMGYRRMGSYQLIVKGQNDQDASVFLRSAALDSEGKTMFGLSQGAAGVGAVSAHAFCTLGDEPLFFSREGIFGVYSSDVVSETSLQNRSYFVDRLLLRESGPERACATVWNGYYILCLNGRCYVLDSRQRKTYSEKSGGAYVYECFYWTNIPAACFCEADGTLYFGADDGRFCRFNSDLADSSRYSDDGEPIDAWWATKVDDDGSFSRYKTTKKNAVAVLLKPDTASSIEISVSTQKNALMLVAAFDPSRFDFAQIDFEKFSFSTGSVVQTVPIKKRVKKYVTLQIIARNNVSNESFGICAIMKTYSIEGYVKRAEGGTVT